MPRIDRLIVPGLRGWALDWLIAHDRGDEPEATQEL